MVPYSHISFALISDVIRNEDLVKVVLIKNVDFARLVLVENEDFVVKWIPTEVMDFVVMSNKVEFEIKSNNEDYVQELNN